MKVAVAAIALDEEKFVERFMESAKEADGVFVLDTGSTDRTVELLQAAGATVHVGMLKPWRFDIPRNAIHQLVPADYDVVVSFDLDEVFTKGWVEEIKKAWTPQTTRMRYQYVWNHLEDGRDGITFWYDKIVCRNGYRWIKPVHEILNCYGGEEVQTYCDKFTLHHWPDSSKSRGSYLPLLEQGCKDEPNDDRNSHYLGREYMYYGRYDDAIRELQRHLSLPSATWNAERCASMRFIARSYCFKQDYVNAELWALKACAESSTDREPWLELGKIYYYTQNWPGLYAAMKRLLTITERPKSYICEVDAWYALPYDYCSIAAFNLGMYQEAVDMCEKAIEQDSSDQRLLQNMLLMKERVARTPS